MARSAVVARPTCHRSSPRSRCICGIRTQAMDRAINALPSDDQDGFDNALAQVINAADTLDHRIELAQAVIELRDQGHIPPKLAAVAVRELDRERSAFHLSSVSESLVILAGDRPTPVGLFVAMT